MQVAMWVVYPTLSQICDFCMWKANGDIGPSP